jgi:hypothetical protein
MMWRMLGDGILDGLRGRLPARVWDERQPAHLHVDLLPECAITAQPIGLLASFRSLLIKSMLLVSFSQSLHRAGPDE